MKPTIRNVTPNDAEGMIAFSKGVGSETDFLSYGPEGLGYSVNEEEKILEGYEQASGQVMFIALVDGEIVGSLGFSAGRRQRLAHVGEFGMAVSKQHWGNGIGSALIDKLLTWCGENSISKVNLRVRTDNDRAISLYRRKGFEIEGKCAKDIKVGNAYYDHYLMGLYLPDGLAKPYDGR